MELQAGANQYLTFLLADEEYGVDILRVQEIRGWDSVTKIPNTPDYVLGVINLRGKVIPVMDIRTRFRLPYRDYDERTCIIVVEIKDTPVGLVVDEVQEVMDIPEESVEPPPKATGKVNNFLQGVGKVGDDVKIILNVSQLLFDTEIEELSMAA